MKKLNRRTWAIIVVGMNRRLWKRLPRIARMAKLYGLVPDLTPEEKEELDSLNEVSSKI